MKGILERMSDHSKELITKHFYRIDGDRLGAKKLLPGLHFA